MAPDPISMSDESPPPYSAIVGTPLAEPPESPDVALPFSNSDRLAARILALVSEGKTLDSRFKDVSDVASAGAKFEYQEPALILCQRFEALVWESRNIAGVALVAIKDFNEIVLYFLSEPDVVAQDRLKELASASKLLQRDRASAAKQKSSFDALIKELDDFHRILYSESSALNSKRRKQSHSGGRVAKNTRSVRQSKTLLAVSRSEPLCGLSTVTASLGAMFWAGRDYALYIESVAEHAVFPSRVVRSPPEAQAQAQDTSSGTASSSPQERKRLCPPIECAESAALLRMVDALVCDLRAFVTRIEVFDTVFAELARAQDIFVVYLKDGQSVANLGYRSEINRLRRQLPCMCDALDAYSKARLS